MYLSVFYKRCSMNDQILCAKLQSQQKIWSRYLTSDAFANVKYYRTAHNSLNNAVKLKDPRARTTAYPSALTSSVLTLKRPVPEIQNLKIRWSPWYLLSTTPRIQGNGGITPLFLVLGTKRKQVVNFTPRQLYPWKRVPCTHWMLQ
jgi:hypothetical protein